MNSFYMLIKRKKLVIICLTTTMILAVVAPLKSYMLQWLLDSGSKTEAIKWLLFGTGITVASHIFEYISRVSYTQMANSAIREVRERIADMLSVKPVRSYLEEDSGKKLSMLTNDVQSLYDDCYMPIYDIMMWGGIGLAALLMLAIINPLLMVMSVIMGMIPLTVPKAMARKLSDYRLDLSSSNASYTSKMGEMIRGFETLALSSSRDFFTSEQKKEAEENAKKDFSLRKKMCLSQVLASFIAWLPSLVVLFVGVLLVFQGTISLSSLITANTLTNFVLSPMRSISNAYAKFKSSMPIRKKLDDEMRTIERKDEPGKLEDIRQLDFKIQSFSYPNSEKNVLRDAALILQRGTKKAIVGKSGSGKSTIAKLILKYYEKYEGSILINDQELRSIAEDTYYRHIAVIPQKCCVFADTIANNICLGKTYGKEEIEDVLTRVGLKDLIDSLPEGIDTRLEEAGGNLSGGQNQRIAIARALLRKCDLMVVDEATSSLDIQTTRDIMEILLSLDCTVLVITHDIFDDYMKKFDELYYIEDGTITEQGSYDGLLLRNGSFAKLYANVPET